jgi:hypothetical protein
MKIAIYLLLASSLVWAQPSGKNAVTNNQPLAQSGATVRNPLADAQGLSELLKQIQASSERSDGDVARLRIDKWKADAASKQQAQASATSIRRNLTNAVPDLVQRVQASPGSLNANFRLYRNLNALYDTFSALTESAGAFGPKEQYESLATDIAQLDQLRHQVAERVDLLAGANDAELARLRAQVAATAAGTKPPSKIVVNDEQPKPKKKPKSTQSSTQNPPK